MLLTWSLIYIWHELFLTPKYGIGKVSLPSPELMLSCCECVCSVCILWALIFKHLLKYAIILVWFSFLLYACQWTIRLFIFFSPMSVRLYLLYCMDYILHKWRPKSIKLCQIMHLWRLKTKWLCLSHFQPAFHIQILSSGLYDQPNTFFQVQILGGRFFVA